MRKLAALGLLLAVIGCAASYTVTREPPPQHHYMWVAINRDRGTVDFISDGDNEP